MMNSKKAQKGTDVLQYVFEHYVKGDPDMEALVEQERVNADVAHKIYDLRMQAGLTQKALAKRIGTTASVICRLEDADYEGHSLSMLNRIAEALDHRVEIRIVAKTRRSRQAAHRVKKEKI